MHWGLAATRLALCVILTASAGLPTAHGATVNTPPSVTVPAALTVNENADRIFGGVDINDGDIPSGSPLQVQVTISCSHGSITLSSTTNLNFAFAADADGAPFGTGTADPTMTFRATLGDIANALATITYRANADYYGPDTITYSVNDLGNSGTRVGSGSGSITPGGSANSWVNTHSTTVNVRFRNSIPSLAANVPVLVPIGGAATIAGGTFTPPSYPVIGQPLNSTYSAPAPAGAGTVANAGSNLVAIDSETKDDNAIIYTIGLGTSQGSLTRNRPSDGGGLTLTVGSTFTQNDLNSGYISYSHNGALSGNDGFVFTVSDDNAVTHPSGVTDVVNGISTTLIFNIQIDRSRPIAIFSGGTPAFREQTHAPVLIDTNPQTRVVNEPDPVTFVPFGLAGRLTAAVTIPASSQVPVEPNTVSGDSHDALTVISNAPITVDPTTHVITYNGIQDIGTYSGGANGAPLIVNLTSASDIAVSAVSALLRSIAFVNTSANPSASPRRIAVTVETGFGVRSVPAVKQLSMVLYDDPPMAAAPIVTTMANLAMQGTINVTDVDSNWATMALSIPPGQGPSSGSVSSFSLSGPNRYTFTYVPQAQFSGADRFQCQITDDGGASTTLSIDVRVSPLNGITPQITSRPPCEVQEGIPAAPNILSYTFTVDTRSLPGAILNFKLVNAPNGMTITSGDIVPVGNQSVGTITWPIVKGASDYLEFGILAIDKTGWTAGYQPVLIRIHPNPFGGG